MAKINVLDSSIYNKISAGEVVERPASVIKELTENCIDAGAKNIIIDIKDGGIENMTVIDDGCGIEYDSVKNAFLPHATSKITSVEDLNSILTLGFRGEALASIASVSEVEMLTKTSDDELATKIVLNAGNVLSCERCSAPTGTKVSVNNLFFNVPARKKFLKKPKQEEHEITTIVQRLILSNPNVSIRYIVDGKQIYYSTGKNLEDAIFSIYGISTLQSLLKFDEKRNDMHLYGYIGKPSFTKANRTYQTLVVNKRYVQNSNISVAVNKGFETHLMKGQFPFFIMFLDINPERVDVNVHPTKMEIRFEDNGEIFSFVYRTVSGTILSNQDLFTMDMIDKPINSLNKLEKSFEPIVQGEQQDAFKKYDNIFAPIAQSQKTQSQNYSNSNNFEAVSNSCSSNDAPFDIDVSSIIDKVKSVADSASETEQSTSDFESFKNTIRSAMQENIVQNNNSTQTTSPESQQTEQSPISSRFINGKEVFTDEQGSYTIEKINIYDKNDKIVNVKEIKIYEDMFDPNEIIKSFNMSGLGFDNLDGDLLFKKTDGAPTIEDIVAQQAQTSQKENTTALLKNGYKVVGKLFNTFLFVEHEESAILIDQHAAHERVIYDRLQSYYGNKDRALQPLLIPYILELNYQEKNFIEQNLQQFLELGFDIEEFGDKAYKISAVPLLLGGNFDCKTFFDDILRQYGKEVKVKDSLKFNEYLMQRACKAAIKAGNDMSESEICYLVDAVIENKTELFCPHGRPIAIKIDRKDVEKWFKRVL